MGRAAPSLVLAAGGSLANGAGGAGPAVIRGGYGGSGGQARQGAYGGAGGAGGVGVDLGGGVVINGSQGTISGGGGGRGNPGAVSSGGGGAGGVAVLGSGSTTLNNAGVILGGAGGVPGTTHAYYGAGGVGAQIAGRADVVNSGTIAGGEGGAGGVGVVLAGGGRLVNSGLVKAGLALVASQGGAGVVLSAGGELANSGAILGSYFQGSRVGDGIDVAGHAILRNGSATAGGAVIAGRVGVDSSGPAVTVINYGAITGSAASVTLGSSSDKLVAESGCVFNGMVLGGGGALELAGGAGTLSGIGYSLGVSGSLALGASGFATYLIDKGGAWTSVGTSLNNGKTLVDAGTLDFAGHGGASGLIEAAAGGAINADQAVLDFSGGGVLEALAGGRITLFGADIVGATLSTVGSGLVLVKGSGNELDGSASSLTFAGRLSLLDGAGLTLAGSIVGRGQLTVSGVNTATTLLIASGGATLSGGGKVYLAKSLDNQIAAQTPGAILVNVDDRILGAGTIGGGGLSLVNDAKGLIASFGAQGLTLSAPSITNAGLIEADRAALLLTGAVVNTGKLLAIGATLTLDGTVSGAGVAEISLNGAISAAGAFAENVTFVGGAGALTLGRSQGYTGALSGFSTAGKTTLDLLDIAFVSASEASFSGTTTSGVLTVSAKGHSARITLLGNYTDAAFTCANDGHGGVLIKAQAAAASAFAAAIAGLDGGAGVGARAFAGAQTQAPGLARPAG